MGKNEHGKDYIAKVELECLVVFGGAKRPSEKDVATLHHRAHEDVSSNADKSDLRGCDLLMLGLRDETRCATSRSPPTTAPRCSRGSASARSTTVRDVPAAARARFDLPRRKGEIEVERTLAPHGGQEAPAGTVPFFCGCGAYRHHVPATVDHLIQRSEFLTSYTPYQPEIAQGTLQELFEFQTQVAMLTGMEVANASMYDGSTATAEAVLMAHRITSGARRCSPAACIRTIARRSRHVSRFAGDEVVALAPARARRRRPRRTIDDDASPASSCRTPTCSASSRDLSRSRSRARRRARCWSSSSPKRCRSAS